MTDQRPIAPPRELVEQWRTEPEYVSLPRLLSVITMSENRLMEICQKSAQYGATCLPKSSALAEKAMTELSPAQKAVAAFSKRYELCGLFDDDWVEQCLAAAIEELAAHAGGLYRNEIRAIAAELRGTNPTNQED